MIRTSKKGCGGQWKKLYSGDAYTTLASTRIALRLPK